MPRPAGFIAPLLLAITAAACAFAQPPAPNRLIDLLGHDQVAFGLFVPNKTAADGASSVAKDSRVDFVFYDMEHGLNLPQFAEFRKALRDHGGKQTVLVRFPELHNTARDAAMKGIADVLAAGADGIVVPETQSKEEAEFAIAQLRRSPRGVWPADPSGSLIAYIMVEDKNGLAALNQIAALPGVGILSGGQGTLTQSFNGDKQAVENALQTILAAAKANHKACSKLISENDAEKRVRQGYRVIIASGKSANETLDQGHRAAGR